MTTSASNTPKFSKIKKKNHPAAVTLTKETLIPKYAKTIGDNSIPLFTTILDRQKHAPDRSQFTFIRGK